MTTEGARFRIVYVADAEARPLIYMRVLEKRADGSWWDTCPYGPLIMENENFHEFAALLELGNRAAGKVEVIEHLRWGKEPFNVEVPSILNASTKENAEGQVRGSSGDAREASNNVQGP